MISEHQVIAGHYQIIERIGAGGMGEVWRGVDTRTDASVAVKILKKDVIEEAPEMVERFTREGEALRQLNHPNIVKVLASVQENDQHFIVMELVEGGTLADLCKQEPLPIERVLAIALELADALSRAHHLKIIHRDIKPGNVLLASDGTPRLTDFGIARVGTSRITETGAVVGTLAYLSPEAFQGAAPDSRTDIWAFGVLLYEMLTGQHPFAGNNMANLMNTILTQPIPDLKKFRPDIPEALIALLNRMLHKDRRQRLASVRQVGAEIEALLEGLPTPIRPMKLEGGFASDLPLTPLTPTPNNLSIQATPFVGRAKELAEVEKLIETPGVRLVTLLGPGGMGKTRLSQEVARRQAMAGHFAQGVYFVPLASLSSINDVASGISCAADFCMFGQNADDKQQLLDYLREKEMLLILDNFEHLITGAGLVHEILQSAPGVKVLATSRERLSLQSETLFMLDGLDVPEWELPQDAENYEAVQLFIQSARRVQPDFALTPDNLLHIARICRAVQGMPLGIELAAAWVEMLSLPEIVQEIEQNLDFLETEMRDVPERQRSLRAVFEYSWNLLTSEERTAFSKLSVFRRGFTRQAAQQVTGATLKTLTTMVNKSLLKRSPNGRYEVHELLRQYGEQQLDSDSAIRAEHARFYGRLLRDLVPDLKGKRQMEALREIEADFDNIRLMWRWSVEHRDDQVIDEALNSLWLFAEMRGWLVEIRDHFGEAIQVIGDPLVKARLQVRQGWFYNRFGEREHAQQLIAEGLQTLREKGTRNFDLALALSFSAYVYPQNLWAERRHYFEEALDIYRQIGDQWGTACVLHDLGNSYWTSRDQNFEKGFDLLSQSLELHRSIGNVYGTAYSLQNLGNLHNMVKHDYEAAYRYLKESLALRRQLGSKFGIAMSLHNMGVNADARNTFDEAEAYYTEGLALQKELGNTYNAGWILSLMGWMYFRIGDYDRSLQHFQEGTTLLHEFEHRELMIEHHAGFGWNALVRGEYAAADKHFQQHQDVAEEYKYPRDTRAGNLYHFGRLALLQHQFAKADQLHQELLATGQAHEYQWAIGNALYGLGVSAVLRGEYQAGVDYLTQAIAAVEPQDYSLKVLSLSYLGRAYLGLGDLAQAREQLAAGVAALQIKNPILQPQQFLLEAWAHYFVAAGQPDRAVEIAAALENAPQVWHYIQQNARQMIADQQKTLAAEDFTAAYQRGQGMSLDAVMGELKDQ